MKVSLIINKDKTRAIETAQRVAQELSSLNAEVYTCADCPIEGTTVMDTAEDVIRICDIAVTVGGDGTIIHNAKFAALYGA